MTAVGRDPAAMRLSFIGQSVPHLALAESTIALIAGRGRRAIVFYADLHWFIEMPGMETTPLTSAVVCYGGYDLLLLTRQWMLMKLGCPCDAARSYPEFQALLCKYSPSIIVLCQTLTGRQVGEAAGFAAEYSPGSWLVVMYTGAPKCIPPGPNVLLPSAGGTAAFTEMMASLLGIPSTSGARQGDGWTPILHH